MVSADRATREFVGRGLRELGNSTDTVVKGADGFFLASENTYDAIIIERNLPDINGVTLLKLLRKSSIATPILMIDNNRNVEETVEMLNAGADDCLSKPIILAEMIARLRAITRRGPSLSDDNVLKVADLELDQLTRRVERAGNQIVLQPRAFQLLSILMSHEGQVVTRTTLLEKVWEYHFEPNTSVVETHISRLRDKVDRPFDKQLIRTVRGGGYMISA